MVCIHFCRYMPTPPMVMPQYMTTYAGYYSQPVYVVHSGTGIPPSQAGFGLQPVHPMQAHGHHYLPHPLEQVHHPVPYDFSVPPPNYTYVPMAPPPHPPPMLAAHPPPFNIPGPTVYKIPDRFVPLEGAHPMGAGSMGGMHHERMQPLPSGEILMEPVNCEALDDGTQSQGPNSDLRSSNDGRQQFSQHHFVTGQEDPDVAEVIEIIEEIHFERPKGYQPNAGDEATYVEEHIKAGAVTPSDDGCDRRSQKSWYDECTTQEQKAADNAEIKEIGVVVTNSHLLQKQPPGQHRAEEAQHATRITEGKQSETRQAMTSAAAAADRGSNVMNSHHNHIRQNSHGDSGPRDGDGYHHRRRDDARDGRQGDSRDSTRERSGGRFDNHGRRSLTPEKRFHRNNPNYGNGGSCQREDCRYSNPEHGATHLRARRPRGGYDQASSRENSTGRRDNNGNNNNNRQRYYPSPKRDSHDHRYDNHGGRRYDSSLRRGTSGSYRQQWRDGSLPSISRGGNSLHGNVTNNNSSGGNNNTNSRKPPLPRQDSNSCYSAAPVATTNGTASFPVSTEVTSLKDTSSGVGPSHLSAEKSKDRSDEDPSYLEFLGPSFLGINDRLDVKGMMSRRQAVSMDSSSDDGEHNTDHANGNISNTSNINSSKQLDLGNKRGGFGGHHSNLCQARKDHRHE